MPNLFEERVQILKDGISGKRVICRSNEDEPLMIGEVIGEGFAGGVLMVKDELIVQDEADGRVYNVMGIVIPHTDEMQAFLETMIPKKQYEFLKEIVQFIRGVDKLAVLVRQAS